MDESLDPRVDDPTAPAASENLLLLAWRRKSLLLLGLVVGVVLGLFNYAQQKPVYESRAQVMVIRKQGNPLSGDMDPRAYFFDDYIATHQTLLKSPLIIKRAVEKQEFKDLVSYRGIGDPVNAVSGALTVSRDTKDSSGGVSNILNLSFKGPNPEECAAVLDIVIQSYKEFLKEKYQNASLETVSQMAEVADQLRKSLDEKEKTYSEFQLEVPLVYGKDNEGQSVHEAWLSQVQTKRLALQVQRAELQSRIESLQKAVAEGRGRQILLTQFNLPTLSEKKGEGQSLEQQLFQLQIAEQQLLADYGPDHPDVRAIRQRLTMTREFFGQTKGGANSDPVAFRIAALEQERADIDTTLKALDGIYDREYKAAKEIAKLKIEDKRHREGIARANRLYQPTIERLSEMKLIENFGGFDAEVIAPPRLGYQIAPNAFRILFMAGLLGLFGGAGLAYLVDTMDKSFRSPAEIRRRLGVSIVGHVPFLHPDETPEGEQVVSPLDPIVCTYHDPKSPQAEAFRGIRTSLYFSMHGAHKVIQVTSPNQSEGKSTLISNLAVSIAQTGKKVLLVDCDFRRPRQHRLFGLSAEVGLASVMIEEAELQDAIQATPMSGLSLLPCGPKPSNPAELLTSPRFKELLDTLREQFDYVLVDTPPLLAVSDPSVVAPRVDGVILTICLTKNGRPGAERAREILGSVGANVIGVVINRREDEETSYGYSYGGNYYDYYSGYEEDETSGKNNDAQNVDQAAPKRSRRQKATLMTRLQDWWQ